MSNLTLQLDAPYLSYEEYSRRVGISIHLIRRQVRQGILPIRPKRHPKDTPFINMVALYKKADEQLY